MPNFISEDDIETALLDKLKDNYGFEVLDCFTARPEDLNDKSNRKDKRDVIFGDRLKSAALRLNPQIPENTVIYNPARALIAYGIPLTLLAILSFVIAAFLVPRIKEEEMRTETEQVEE